MRDVVDLRPDTQKAPAPLTQAAVASAEVGDDVWEHDPTARVAALAVGPTVTRSVPREIKAGC